MPTHPLPIIALTGFLGAGKTTLLNHMLEHNHGLKIGVVVNDYGDINIDAGLIEGQSDATLELTNGCICCSMDSMELDEAIAQFAYPGSPIDYIVIEASGLAEPADLAQTLQQAGSDYARLDAIVAVVDAANWGTTAEIETNTLEHIEASDIVVLNKLDLVDDSAKKRIEQAIIKHNPRTRILPASNAVVDLKLLFDPDTTRASAPDHDRVAGHAGHTHLHNRYSSVSFTSDRPLDPVAFQSFVNQQIPASVYRAKGVVNLGDKGQGRKYHFQLVGKRLALTWEQWENEAPHTALVFIGKQFNTAILKQQMAACIDAAPRPTSPPSPVVLPRHRE